MKVNGLKKELRAFYKQKLVDIPESIFAEKNRALSAKIQGFLASLFSPSSSFNFNPNRVPIIGAYAAIEGEPDPIADGLQTRFLWSFPDCRENSNGKMAFYLSSLQSLELNRHFGVWIKTPPGNAEKVIPDLLLIPGLAFTRTGERLGRGKAFYDRYFEQTQFQGIKVGVCFNEQLAMSLPLEEHDVSVDVVVTDSEIIVINKKSED